MYTNDRDGFDACEEVVDAVAMEVRGVAYLEGILPHSRNLTAMGKIVDAVLSMIPEGITQLPDITTGHPHSGGLFVEVPEQVSSRLWYSLSGLHRVAGSTRFQCLAMVACVPSWLKFFYLPRSLRHRWRIVPTTLKKERSQVLRSTPSWSSWSRLFSNTPLRTEGVQKLQREHIVGRTSSGLIRDPALDIHYFF
jgi:hypothetical protein